MSMNVQCIRKLSMSGIELKFCTVIFNLILFSKLIAFAYLALRLLTSADSQILYTLINNAFDVGIIVLCH